MTRIITLPGSGNVASPGQSAACPGAGNGVRNGSGTRLGAEATAVGRPWTMRAQRGADFCLPSREVLPHGRHAPLSVPGTLPRRIGGDAPEGGLAAAGAQDQLVPAEVVRAAGGVGRVR